jgi:hypothetical protein
MNLSQVGGEDMNCPEVAQDKVQYWACVINDVILSDFVTAEFVINYLQFSVILFCNFHIANFCNIISGILCHQ